jgi:hypothetical protein
MKTDEDRRFNIARRAAKRMMRHVTHPQAYQKKVAKLAVAEADAFMKEFLATRPETKPIHYGPPPPMIRRSAEDLGKALQDRLGAVTGPQQEDPSWMPDVAPKGIPALPDGYRYLGKGGSFRLVPFSDGFEGAFAGGGSEKWYHYNSIPGDDPEIHYAAPADSEIARMASAGMRLAVDALRGVLQSSPCTILEGADGMEKCCFGDTTLVRAIRAVFSSDRGDGEELFSPEEELPRQLPRLPVGFVYLGRGGEFRVPEGRDGFDGAFIPPDEDEWVVTYVTKTDEPNIRYAARHDSHVARLNRRRNNT